MDTSRNSQTPSNWRKSFWSLFVTQCQGAFSDNVFKFVVIYTAMSQFTSESDQDWQVFLIGMLFAVPFILFTMTGGYCADKFSKRTVAVRIKMAEICVMSIGACGLYLSNLYLLFGVIFLMSAQSAFFGPVKYGLLPELLEEKRLSWGNGFIGLGTFIAIILGTIAGGQLFDAFDNQLITGIILVALAATGFLASRKIGKLPPANPTKKYRINFLSEFWQQFSYARKDRVLFLSILGGTYFWFLGAMVQQAVMIYGRNDLQLSFANTSLLFATMAVGIGIGSFTAGYVSARKIEYGLIPLGALGVAVFSFLMGQEGLSTREFGIFLGFLGFFGGFYIIPINALVQHRPDRSRKGSIIAMQAFLSWIGILLAAAVYILIKSIGFSTANVFTFIGAVTLAGTIYVVWLLPDSLLRLLLVFLTHTLYRIRIQGRDNIPDKEGILFVCNHLSYVDALLLVASIDRPIRFIVAQDVSAIWFIKPFAKILKAIPIPSTQRPRETIQALKLASAMIQSGEVVCIFAEGQISRTGNLLPFRRGYEKIMRNLDNSIIPVNLDGVWGSIFSYERGRFLFKWPRQIPFPVTVSFGKAMPADSKPFEVREAVQELATEAWHFRKANFKTLHRSFVRTAKTHPLRFAMSDPRSGRLKYGALLPKVIFLARRLRPLWKDQEKVGILLPPSVPGALVNYAAFLLGKVPVNLNYTLSESAIASCIEQCGIKTIVTSKLFLTRIKLSLPENTVFLEKLAAKPGIFEKLAGLLMAWLLPVRLLEKALGQSRKTLLEDTATIIFSSGSTGDPKGVMLSHYNIVSNIEQVGQTLALGKKDVFLGILPFFHSFGFTGALVLPPTLGLGVTYHANPLDAKVIGGLIKENRVTTMITTPTFLQIYLRGCQPEQLESVEFVMVGAEKLPERLAKAFEEKFGLYPVEGYGCTECSPVVSANTRDLHLGRLHQIGIKPGKIGHPLPGISIRIVDPDTQQSVPVGIPGLMLVKGPNVMQGYLGKSEKTAEVLKNGWYTTGDIVAVDEDGFLTITDRLSRFSKIGGEMVPHIKVEDVLHELVDETEKCFAVTGLPDERKGERLVVLHTLTPGQLEECQIKLADADLPNLWKPRKDLFFFIENLPYLGSGKLDLTTLKDLARQYTESKS
ncbi:MAG: acyl-[ACP]--phospholipid O-acyltransferase [Verrucomicrobia bacterium]|nr:acyl-[ACP]--phospholipid O-acyltransferase [Verrucomicrobiota bacterium]